MLLWGGIVSVKVAACPHNLSLVVPRLLPPSAKTGKTMKSQYLDSLSDAGKKDWASSSSNDKDSHSAS